MIERINTWARKMPTWLVYILYIIPVPVLLYQGINGALGPDPVKALEHELGEIALQLLIIGLTFTPLRRFLKLNLLKFRRTFGVLAFTYVVLHLLVWAILDVQSLSAVWADIVKRPFITIGMASLVLLLPLALTSNNWSMRKLGPRWRKLHRLTYPAVVLGGVHYIMVKKVWEVEPLVYLAVILVLIAMRYLPSKAASLEP